MSKKFKKGRCAYCGAMPANEEHTADHVVGREFFMEDKRANLPKVPACKACNGAKAALEHYLTAVLPFGGQHADALDNLSTMVPKRLAKNLKLKGELGASIKQKADTVASAKPEGTIPFEPNRLADLCRYIGLGLLLHRHGTYLDEKHVAAAACITEDGEKFLERQFGIKSSDKAPIDFGDGTFRAWGIQLKDGPQSSVWFMSFYGGITLSGDPDAPEQVSTSVFVVTGPIAAVESLMQAINGRGARAPAPDGKAA